MTTLQPQTLLNMPFFPFPDGSGEIAYNRIWQQGIVSQEELRNPDLMRQHWTAIERGWRFETPYPKKLSAQDAAVSLTYLLGGSLKDYRGKPKAKESLVDLTVPPRPNILSAFSGDSVNFPHSPIAAYPKDENGNLGIESLVHLEHLSAVIFALAQKQWMPTQDSLSLDQIKPFFYDFLAETIGVWGQASFELGAPVTWEQLEVALCSKNSSVYDLYLRRRIRDMLRLKPIDEKEVEFAEDAIFDLIKGRWNVTVPHLDDLETMNFLNMLFKQNNKTIANMLHDMTGGGFAFALMNKYEPVLLTRFTQLYRDLSKASPRHRLLNLEALADENWPFQINYGGGGPFRAIPQFRSHIHYKPTYILQRVTEKTKAWIQLAEKVISSYDGKSTALALAS